MDGCHSNELFARMHSNELFDHEEIEMYPIKWQIKKCFILFDTRNINVWSDKNKSVEPFDAKKHSLDNMYRKSNEWSAILKRIAPMHSNSTRAHKDAHSLLHGQ